jgi:hypothetical protein
MNSKKMLILSLEVLPMSTISCLMFPYLSDNEDNDDVDSDDDDSGGLPHGARNHGQDACTSKLPDQN